MVYILCTQAKIPAYLGSSFAFIATMQALMKNYGYPAVGQGAIAGWSWSSVIVALLIARFGSRWLDKILPPIVVGPIIIVIGLSLATTAANDAMFNASGKYSLTYFGVAIFTLVITIIFNMFLKGFPSMIPVLLGIICGYLMALFCGIVDLSGVESAKWFSLPAFDVLGVSYKFKWYPAAIITMAPIAFVTMTEHMGHIMVLNKLTKRNFFEDPGLHRTLLGDGLSSESLPAFLGGPPTTSYGENIGVFGHDQGSQRLRLGRGSLFCHRLLLRRKGVSGDRIHPNSGYRGISFLLFGMIAANGLRILVDNKVDFEKKRNLVIASVILVIGIGGTYLKIGSFQLTSIALATVFGILLNLILPEKAASEQ